MSWTQIYAGYKTSGAVGKCPKCGGNLTVNSTQRSVTFNCESCKSFRHFDEIKTGDGDQAAQKNSGA